MFVRTVFLVAVGLVFVGAALWDVGLPEQCERADGLAADHRLADARTEYVHVLQDDASADCALAGLKRTVNAQCQAAARLQNAGRREEATSAYLAIATTDPVPTDVNCAHIALKVPGPSCDGADRQTDEGLLTAAQEAYTKLAGEPTTRVCAAAGLVTVREKRCAAARALEADGFDAAAAKAFTTIATTEPAGSMRACMEG